MSGQLDPELADEGREQAARLAEVLRAESLDAVYASTLTRARETAGPAAAVQALAVRALDDLREQHMGVLQGRFRDERDPEAHAIWQARAADRAGYRVPGGESWAELKARAARVLQAIGRAHAGGSVLVVGHRNTNRALLANLLGLDDAVAIDLKISSARVIEVDTLRGTIGAISLKQEDAGRRRAWRPE